MNDSLDVFVGEPVTVREDVRVTIDCSPLIDAAVSKGIQNPTVTWYKTGAVITNGSTVNVVIFPDNRLCIITDTLLAVGGQLGTDGNYSCQVCTSMECNITNSIHDVCGK